MKRNGLSFERPILIVEDDRKSSELLALYLAREGFSTIAAYDGRQALELASTRRLLFTVLDVMLPDINGWEICRRLRTFSNVPMTTWSSLSASRNWLRGSEQFCVARVCVRTDRAYRKAI
jgi:DNA-binding response OmpR family regulator